MPKWSATGVTGVRFKSTLAAREIILNRVKKDFYLTVLYVTFFFFGAKSDSSRDLESMHGVSGLRTPSFPKLQKGIILRDVFRNL